MKMKYMSIIAAGLGALLAVHSASAGTDTYTTSGSFTGGGSAAPGTGGGALTVGFVIDAPTAVGFNDTLATFTANGPAFTPTAGDKFTLTLTQTPPGSSKTYGQASVTGDFIINGSGLYLNFLSPTSVSLFDGTNTITYTLNLGTIAGPNTLLVAPPTTGGPGLTPLTANVTSQVGNVTPLPATFYGGTALLGMLGFSQLKRRKLA